LELLNGQLPPLDLSSLSSSYDYSQTLDGFSALSEHEQPLFSAGLSSASIDWSHYDGLEFNDGNFGASSYSQAASFTGFDFSNIDHPALTATSTSGEVSEVEDFVPVSDATENQTNMLNNQYGSEFDASDFGGEIDGYRLSTASSYVGLPQSQMLAGSNNQPLDIDAFLKGVDSYGSNHGLQLSGYADAGKIGQTPSPYDDPAVFQMLSGDDEAFWMNSFPPNSLTLNQGRNDLPEENIWAQ
jgi:hypothetical protein